MKKVAIVGAGFAGVTLCKNLASNKNFEIHLIDKRNHHLFQPLLYQVAMAGLNPSDIAIPIRKLFGKEKNVFINMSEVTKVESSTKKIFYDDKWHQFDYIIFACGANHFYFNQNQWEDIAPGLKTIEQATEIRRRVLNAFEMAEKETDKLKQEAYLTFAVVGGGPTGVELAGSIAEMAQKTLRVDFKNADLTKTKVILIEAGENILPAFPQKLSLKAKQDLEKLGVEVRTNSMAKELSFEGLKINEDFFRAKTILWAAGVKSSKLSKIISSELGPQDRVKVNKDLSINENKDIFVLGDQAYLEGADGKALPGIAPVAIQQGQYLAKLLKGELKGNRRASFKYWDKGIMATIGRSKAVVSTYGFNFSGMLAWMMWVFIHIVYIMKFRNRVFIFFQWIWSYFNFGRGARLIINKTWKFYD